jgi:hypothetical protein
MILSLVSMILIAGSQAVDVQNFGSVGCAGRPMSGCPGLPQLSCCKFRATYTADNGAVLGSATHSVAWWNLQACDVASWFRKNLGTRAACGREKGTVIGPSSFTCQTTTRIPEREDGAMWFVMMHPDRSSSTLTENRFKVDEAIRGNCPSGPGVTKSLPNPEFQIAMDGKPHINTNLHVQFPVGWGVAISKRNVAGRLELEEEEQNSACKEIHYADTYHWVGENSVWVIKGTKGNHEALDRYHEETPDANFEDFIHTIDAIYYPHCK